MCQEACRRQLILTSSPHLRVRCPPTWLNLFAFPPSPQTFLFPSLIPVPTLPQQGAYKYKYYRNPPPSISSSYPFSIPHSHSVFVSLHSWEGRVYTCRLSMHNTYNYIRHLANLVYVCTYICVYLPFAGAHSRVAACAMPLCSFVLRCVGLVYKQPTRVLITLFFFF